jgi:alpha-galactosidase
MSDYRDWDIHKHNIITGNNLPFSFNSNGISSNGQVVTEDTNGILTEFKKTLFPESDCIEWTPQLLNGSDGNSPLLSKLQSLDLVIAPMEGSSATIHAVRGCANGAAPFATERIELTRGTTWRVKNPGGGKTGWYLPFVNLDLGGKGILCALGWPGRWTFSIEYLADGSLHLTGGIEHAHLVLHPGEEITLPSVLLMFWEGDRLDAHNRFRQHILNHHTPTCNGKPVPDLAACCTWGGMKTHNHLRLIETLRQNQASFDCYWMDAGWFGSEHETDEYQNLKVEDWFFHVGDWRPNPAVHPNGLKPVSDAAHAAGMKFLLWFEVERAIETSPWFIEHPEWFFSKRNTTELVGRTCHWHIFNFGNLEARKAMTEWIANRIEEYGIDILRQDCNAGLSESWDEQDSPDRIGISEIRYVEGLLTFWDELHVRFPHLVFDIVQRRDLESISRGMDMSRADHEFLPHTDVIASQTALYGLSHWTPLSGTCVPYKPGKDYNIYSGLSSSFATAIFPALSDVPIQVGPPADYPWDWLQHILDTHHQARPFFRGDFYPLLENTSSNQHWAAMQFHRNDLKAGMVMVFRRPDSPFKTAVFRLHGLSDGCTYHLESSVDESLRLDGDTLEVVLSEAPSVAVVFYGKEN